MFKEGDKVRFTIDNLGALSSDSEGTRFADRTYHKGMTGEVINTDLPDGWIAVLPDDRDARVLFVPVAPGMIEHV